MNNKRTSLPKTANAASSAQKGGYKNGSKGAFQHKQEWKPGKDWRRGAVPVAAILPKILGTTIAKNGFASAELVAAWPQIVGHQFADCCQPEKVKWPQNQKSIPQAYGTKPNHMSSRFGGTLIIRVEGPKALYLQHNETEILARANQFFGFAALTKLQFVQIPLSKTSEKIRKPDLPNLTDRQENGLAECIDGFDDPELQEAILSLGRGVLRSKLSTS